MDLIERAKKIKTSLDAGKIEAQIISREKEMSNPDFWKDRKSASTKSQQLSDFQVQSQFHFSQI